MNERIKELADMTWRSTSNSASDEFCKKFAELIIQECITIVENLDPGYEDYRNQVSKIFGGDCIEEMKFHFGIEEA